MKAVTSSTLRASVKATSAGQPTTPRAARQSAASFLDRISSLVSPFWPVYYLFTENTVCPCVCASYDDVYFCVLYALCACLITVHLWLVAVLSVEGLWTIYRKLGGVFPSCCVSMAMGAEDEDAQDDGPMGTCMGELSMPLSSSSRQSSAVLDAMGMPRQGRKVDRRLLRFSSLCRSTTQIVISDGALPLSGVKASRDSCRKTIVSERVVGGVNAAGRV